MLPTIVECDPIYSGGCLIGYYVALPNAQRSRYYISATRVAPWMTS